MSHLAWMIVRNNHAFLQKKRGVKKPFSSEPNNLLNLNSMRYNGFVHRSTVGVVPAADNKGFTVITKRARHANKPAKAAVKTTLKSGPRRSLWKLRRLVKNNSGRRDLLKASLRRASAILKSQKPKVSRKPRAKKTE
ncbi:hypothetical protein ONE63_001251 [Megalurothrips usitatus]|nr:hypothetical protein ONE63_001251 [Megalurothrips usitatus]